MVNIKERRRFFVHIFYFRMLSHHEQHIHSLDVAKIAHVNNTWITDPKCLIISPNSVGN